MCNLYSQTLPQDAMRQLFAGLHDLTGNLPVQPEIYPDQMAPVIRHGDRGAELAMQRWGMPSPKGALAGKRTDRGVTNIRNTQSAHWRRWLGPEHRCVVPFSAFNEPDAGRRGRSVWFALKDEAATGFFAGLWTHWTSVRRLKDGPTSDDLFGFLTTQPNAEVAAVHPKAMPVILTEPDDWQTWLHAPWDQARHLQRPLPDAALRVVAEVMPQGQGDDPDDQLSLFE